MTKETPVARNLQMLGSEYIRHHDASVVHFIKWNVETSSQSNSFIMWTTDSEQLGIR